ncbi:MAG TPA: hypothetical protein VGY54_21855 [Polyangiaceae bacterium]|jgi:hypothetical protein|nr:hypothetical protein [Polyangiaceae bacterium]
MQARHWWSRAAGHFHQTVRPLQRVTSFGVSGRFRVGCHWVASFGASAARLLVTDVRLPRQKGHPVDFLVRLPTVACHS